MQKVTSRSNLLPRYMLHWTQSTMSIDKEAQAQQMKKKKNIVAKNE